MRVIALKYSFAQFRKFEFIGLSPTPAKIAPPPQSIHGRNQYREGKVIEQWLIRHLEGISISLRTSLVGMIFDSERGYKKG